FFSTDKKGQYQKSYLNGLPEETDTGLLEFVKTAEKLIAPVLINEIGQSLIAKNYEGWFGVDSLIFKDNNAQLKINPCLEINLRQNMGLLSLKLQHYLPADKKGILSLYYRPGISFKAFAEKMEQDHPLKISENKLESGFFPLTPTTNDADFGAYLLA
ncbi:MAG TPA: hypothetical protein VKA10_11530, partial [Prolixibacteraceae bacterium]|nr:hypothetical protein [Prolixibacteraceae bacterium]